MVESREHYIVLLTINKTVVAKRAVKIVVVTVAEEAVVEQVVLEEVLAVEDFYHPSHIKYMTCPNKNLKSKRKV